MTVGRYLNLGTGKRNGTQAGRGREDDMNMQVRFRGLQTSVALRHHAERKLFASLVRFGQRVRAVEVRIGDQNGPRGGDDKYCRVTVQTPLGAVTVRKIAPDAYAAVHLAIDSLGRTMARRLERSRARRRRTSRVARRAG